MTSRRDTTMYPEKAILRQWPSAVGIRQESDVCPDCQRDGLFYSFVLPEFERTYVSKLDGRRMADCGFWCALCGFGIAGNRPVESNAAAKP